MNGGFENGNEEEGAESAKDRKNVSQSSVGLSQLAFCTRGRGAEGEQANEAASLRQERRVGALRIATTAAER